MIHIFMYALGKQYSVRTILPHAANAFRDTVHQLRNVDQSAIIKSINLIFELELELKFGDDNTLRAVALEEAKLIADKTSVSVTPDLLQAALQAEGEKHIKELMPVASKHLLANGYTFQKPPDAVQKPSDDPTCFRCFKALEGVIPMHTSISGQRLCEHCAATRLDTFTFDCIPKTFNNGYSLTLWQCRRCSAEWSCEGTRTKALPLTECMCCYDGYDFGEDKWECQKCKMIWISNSNGLIDRVSDLKECVCCPLELG